MVAYWTLSSNDPRRTSHPPLAQAREARREAVHVQGAAPVGASVAGGCSRAESVEWVGGLTMRDRFVLPSLVPQFCKCGAPATYWKPHSRAKMCEKHAAKDNPIWKLTVWDPLPDFTDPAQREILAKQAAEAVKAAKADVRKAKAALKRAEADLETVRKTWPK